MCESWYLLPYVNLLDFGQVSPSSWYLVSYLILCVLIGTFFFNWCLIDHLLCWYDSFWYHTSCVDVFWNQPFVVLILSSIMCWFVFWYNLDNLFVSHLGVISSWFNWCFCPNCISFVFRKILYVYPLTYILYGMLVFLVPIYRGYSTES